MSRKKNHRIALTDKFSIIAAHHWVGQLFAFRLRGAALCVLGMHPHLQLNLVLLLAMSRYIGDPDGIRSLPHSPFSGHFIRFCAADVKSQRLLPLFSWCFTRLWADDVERQSDHASHAFPGSTPFLEVPPPPHNTVTGYSPGQVARGGGGRVEALQLHSNSQSHWSNWSTIWYIFVVFRLKRLHIYIQVLIYR